MRSRATPSNGSDPSASAAEASGAGDRAGARRLTRPASQRAARGRRRHADGSRTGDRRPRHGARRASARRTAPVRPRAQRSSVTRGMVRVRSSSPSSRAGAGSGAAWLPDATTSGAAWLPVAVAGVSTRGSARCSPRGAQQAGRHRSRRSRWPPTPACPRLPKRPSRPVSRSRGRPSGTPPWPPRWWGRHPQARRERARPGRARTGRVPEPRTAGAAGSPAPRTARRSARAGRTRARRRTGRPGTARPGAPGRSRGRAGPGTAGPGTPDRPAAGSPARASLRRPRHGPALRRVPLRGISLRRVAAPVRGGSGLLGAPRPGVHDARVQQRGTRRGGRLEQGQDERADVDRRVGAAHDGLQQEQRPGDRGDGRRDQHARAHRRERDRPGEQAPAEQERTDERATRRGVVDETEQVDDEPQTGGDEGELRHRTRPGPSAGSDAVVAGVSAGARPPPGASGLPVISLPSRGGRRVPAQRTTRGGRFPACPTARTRSRA